MKACSTCTFPQPFTNFYRSRRKKDGLHSQCITCFSARVRLYQSRNRRKYAGYQHNQREKKRSANASRPRPDVCESCGQAETTVKSGGIQLLCFDHCHETGIFRGWLCNTCNTSLGLLRNDPTVIRSLANYLEHNDPRNIAASPIVFQPLEC